MIKSFRSPEAEALFNDHLVARFRAIERPARRKLLYLSQARTLQDLLVPPGNRLEALKGNRRGQHSHAVGDQSGASCLMHANLAGQEWPSHLTAAGAEGRPERGSLAQDSNFPL